MAETLKQKRIILAADIFPPESGGPATYVVNLAKELKKRGVDIRIVSLNPYSDVSAAPCPVYAVKRAPKFFRYFHYFFLLLKKGLAADAIYAMGPVNSGFPAYFAGRVLGKKFVVKVVGDYAWEQGVVRYGVKETIDEFQKKNNYPFFVRFLRAVETFVVRRADTIITPSQYLKKIVLGWGAEEKNIELIYNEVDYKTAEPIKHDQEKWLVSAGRLMPWKGMEILIGVISDLSKEYPKDGWKLKIIGEGPEMGNLRKNVADNNLTDIVEFTSNLSNDRVLSYIASADVFILNSAYEGFSHVLIEAHNQGVPVLASNAGGNKEVVAGDNLFEYNNKEEIKQKVLFQSLKGKGPNIHHRFFTNMLEDTIKVLENVCAN